MDTWSKVDYSRHIREASMEMEGLPEVNPPSGRVSGQRLLAAPILKRRRRQNGEEIGKGAPSRGFPPRGVNIGGRGEPGAHQGPRRPLGATPPLATPPGRLGPWWVPSGSHLIIHEASIALIFYIFSPEFI